MRDGGFLVEIGGKKPLNKVEFIPQTPEKRFLTRFPGLRGARTHKNVQFSTTPRACGMREQYFNFSAPFPAVLSMPPCKNTDLSSVYLCNQGLLHNERFVSVSLHTFCCGCKKTKCTKVSETVAAISFLSTVMM